MYHKNLYGKPLHAPASQDWLFFPLIHEDHWLALFQRGWTFSKRHYVVTTEIRANPYASAWWNERMDNEAQS